MNKLAPKICVLRLSALGDVINASSILYYIFKKYPKADITWITSKDSQEVLANLCYKIKIITIDKKQNIASFFSLKKQLKNKEFDYLLHLQTAIRASFFSLAIKAKVRLGFAKDRAKDLQWLFCNEQMKISKKNHVIDNFLMSLNYLDIPYQKPIWKFKENTNFEEDIKKKFGQKKYVLICPCASKAQRNWSQDNYIKLINHLLEIGYCAAISATNSKSHQQVINAIKDKIQNTNCKYFSKGFSISYLFSLVKLATFVIAPDTGPIHIANAFNIPVIGLFAHSDPNRTGAYFFSKYQVSVYQNNVTNKKNKWAKRAKGEKLMQQIKYEDVIKKFALMSQDFRGEN